MFNPAVTIFLLMLHGIATMGIYLPGGQNSHFLAAEENKLSEISDITWEELEEEKFCCSCTSVKHYSFQVASGNPFSIITDMIGDHFPGCKYVPPENFC